MLRTLGLVAALGLLIACSPTAAPAAAPSPAAAAATSPAAPTVAAAPTAAPRPAAALAPAQINVGVLGILADAPLYLARDRGYLAEQALSADYQLFDSGARMVQPLAAGQLDVAPGSPSVGLYNAVARGITLKIVADWVSGTAQNPTASLMLRKDLLDGGEVRDLPDLRGRKIAITAKGTTPHVILGRALERGGLTEADIDLHEMGYPDMLPALTGRSLDLAVLVEPFVLRAQDDGIAVRWRTNEDLVPGQVAATIMYGPSLLEQRPEVGQRFMVAYLKAARDYYDAFVKRDPAARQTVIPLLTQATSFKDAALYDRLTLNAINPDGAISVDNLELDYRWYVQQGLMADVIDVRGTVDNRFVDYAVQQLGRYPR